MRPQRAIRGNTSFKIVIIIVHTCAWEFDIVYYYLKSQAHSELFSDTCGITDWLVVCTSDALRSTCAILRLMVYNASKMHTGGLSYSRKIIYMVLMLRHSFKNNQRQWSRHDRLIDDGRFNVYLPNLHPLLRFKRCTQTVIGGLGACIMIYTI